MSAKQMVAEIHAEVPGTTDLALIPQGDMPVANLIQMALQRMDGQNAPAIAEALDKLVDLYQKIEDRNAVKALNQAIAKFQSECPRITTSKKVDYASKTGGRVNYKYAELDHIQEIIKPVLERNGLSVTWECHTEGNKITEICVVRHRDGAQIQSPFTTTNDSNSAASPQQKDGMAATYAMRRSLGQALGISIGDRDTDGMIPINNAQVWRTITETEAKNIETLIGEVGADLNKFLNYFEVDCVESLPAGRFREAVAMLEKKRGRG